MVFPITSTFIGDEFRWLKNNDCCHTDYADCIYFISSYFHVVFFLFVLIYFIGLNNDLTTPHLISHSYLIWCDIIVTFHRWHYLLFHIVRSTVVCYNNSHVNYNIITLLFSFIFTSSHICCHFLQFSQLVCISTYWDRQTVCGIFCLNRSWKITCWTNSRYVRYKHSEDSRLEWFFWLFLSVSYDSSPFLCVCVQFFSDRFCILEWGSSYYLYSYRCYYLLFYLIHILLLSTTPVPGIFNLILSYFTIKMFFYNIKCSFFFMLLSYSHGGNKGCCRKIGFGWRRWRSR